MAYNHGMTAIILAAGSSSRMGTNKLLLPFRGKPLILSVLHTALAFTGSVIVVTGHEKEGIEEAIAGSGARSIYAPDHGKGQRYSTLAGIEAAGDDDFMILPGDLPLLDMSDLEGTVSLLDTHTIARAFHNGIPGHPVAYRREHGPRLLASSCSMREYLEGKDIGIYEGSIGCVMDTDTPQSYRMILASGDRDTSVLH